VTGYVEVQVACGSEAEADAIATALVEQRLAACVQQLPIRSTYRWDGAVARDDEVLLLVKTTRDRFADVERAVLALHSYDLPAITCVEIVAGSAATLRWLDDSTA
jgi:periplasmic divalent cation tolerance protein